MLFHICEAGVLKVTLVEVALFFSRFFFFFSRCRSFFIACPHDCNVGSLPWKRCGYSGATSG